MNKLFIIGNISLKLTIYNNTNINLIIIIILHIDKEKQTTFWKNDKIINTEIINE